MLSPEEEQMRRRFIIVGTLVGGVLLTLLNWLTAALLPPRYKQFRDPGAVVEIIRSNVSGNDIYTAPQGLFVSVSLRPGSASGPQNFRARVIRQFATEFVVAFGLSLLLLATSIRPPLWAAVFLGSVGLIAGIETHFPNWNWAGFPASYLLAGSGYLAANWFVVGLALGTARQRLVARDAAG
jgi:hypothetical protein